MNQVSSYADIAGNENFHIGNTLNSLPQNLLQKPSLHNSWPPASTSALRVCRWRLLERRGHAATQYDSTEVSVTLASQQPVTAE